MSKGFTTLFFALLFLNLPLLAQERAIGPADRSYSVEAQIRQSINNNDARFTADTVFADIFLDPCSDNVFNFTITDTWGFLSGTNEFEDKEKAQRLSYTANVPFTVTETWTFFGAVSEVGNGTLRMKIYDIAGDGGPNNLKAISQDINVSDILLDNEFSVATVFTYDAPVAISPDTDFFASVDFDDLYVSNDTVGIFMTDEGCGSGDNTWELWNDDTWHAYSGEETWDLNAEIFIAAVVDFAPTSTEDPFVQQGNLRLFPAQPNPARENVSIAFNLQNAANANLVIYSADGKLVRQQNLGRLAAGSYNELINVSELAAGTYVFGIQTETDRLMSRFVVAR